MDALEAYQEIEWEREGMRRAAERYREAAAVADPTTLPSGQRMLRRCVPPLIAKVAEAQDQAIEELNKPGKRKPWEFPIQCLPADALALLTVLAALRRAGTPDDPGSALSHLTSASRELVAAIRDEWQYRQWRQEQRAVRKEHPDAPDLLAQLARRYPTIHRNVWRRWKREAGITPAAWDQPTSVQLGAHLFHLLVEAVPSLFAIVLVSSKGVTSKHLCLSLEAADLMRSIEDRAELARPRLMPMIVPPLPWIYEPRGNLRSLPQAKGCT